jgi:hypothetical protein
MYTLVKVNGVVEVTDRDNMRLVLREEGRGLGWYPTDKADAVVIKVRAGEFIEVEGHGLWTVNNIRLFN